MKVENKNPLVSIVILNWNRLDDTLECLKYVRNITYKNIEIVVVDNGSSDGSKKILSKIKNIIYIDNKTNRGFTGGHIDGYKATSGEFILLLNNDAAINPDYIEKALRYFDQPSIGAVGGRAYFWDENNMPLDVKNDFYSYQVINPITAEAIYKRDDGDVAREVNNVSGSGVIIRRAVIDKIGYFYSPYFAYYEETDLFARMKRSGYKVLYSPELKIWHKNGASSSQYFQYYQLFKNRLIFALRNFDNKSLPPFLISYFKTGIKSSFFRYKNLENKELHRAFSNAFLVSPITIIRNIFSRWQINIDLNISYNLKIISEEVSVSIVLRNNSQTKSITKINLDKLMAKFNDYHQINLTYISDTTEQNIPGLNIVVDTGTFENTGLNLGWLSTNSKYLFFPDFIYDVNPEGLLKMCALLESRSGQIAINSKTFKLKPGNSLLIKRNVLVHYGGVDRNNNLDVDTATKLILYAYFWKKNSVYDMNENTILPSKFIKFLLNLNDSIKHTIKEKVHIDKNEYRPPTKWQLILDKHYRIYQIRNLLRWYFSLKITSKLKLARTKNLVICLVSFDRKNFAIELQHIRNEFLRHVLAWKNTEELQREISIKNHALINNPKDLPVFIICRDRLTPLKKLINWLEKVGLQKIILIDNDSLYPPLLEFLNNTHYQVIRTMNNIGHTVPWTSGIVKTLSDDNFYIVTDPDVIPVDNCPNDVIKYFLKLHEKYFFYQKVGFSLKIDDLPDEYLLKKSVIEWENQFWIKSLEPDVFEAGIDTTFAVYKPYTYKYILHPSIRTGGMYTARHLPWYEKSGKHDDEEIFYRIHANNNITSWNSDELKNRYLKELRKI